MIRLTTLGTIEATSSGDAPAGGLARQSKLVALLTYLAVERSGHAVSVDAVCDVVWSESSTPNARRALNQLLHTGRRLFGLDAVVRSGTGLAIDPGSVACDAAELLHGDVDGEWVLEHYRGELLPGMRLRAASAFDDWLDRARTRLRLRAVEALIDSAASAEPAATLRFAQRALELDPHSERAAELMLGAVAAVRGRAAAWRFFEAYRARLRDDLDLDVPGSITQLALRVCSETSRAVTLSSATPAPPESAAPSPADAQSIPGKTRLPRLIFAARHVAIAALGVLALTLAFARWIRPDRVLATTPIEPSAHLMLDISSSDAVWRSIVVPELALRLGDRGLRVAYGSTDQAMVPQTGHAGLRRTQATMLPPFLLRGDLRASGDSVSGSVQLVETRAANLIRGWRVDVGSSELNTRLAAVSDSIRNAMGRHSELGSILSAQRQTAAVVALADARARLDMAFDASRRSSRDVALRHVAVADSLARVAIAADPGWAQPHLLRAELLQWHAVTTHGYGERALAQRIIGEAIEAASAALALGAGAHGFERRGGLHYLAWAMGAPLPVDPFAAATADLERAVHDGGATAHTWAVLSGLHHAAGRMADADAAARSALAADVFGRNTENILLRLFVAAADAGRDDDARSWCAELQRRSPRRWHSAECTIRTHAWIGEEGAAALDTVSIELSADHEPVARTMRPRLGLMRAAAYASNGRRDRAIQLMDSVLAYAAHDERAPYLSAMVYAQLGELATAHKLLADWVVESGHPSRRAVLYDRWFRPLHDQAGSADAFVAGIIALDSTGSR